MLKRIRQRLVRRLQPLPLQARHVEYSAVASADDESGRPTKRLLDLALEAAAEARNITLLDLQGRAGTDAPFVATWPGEHYRLLAALARVLQPRLVIEIGTFTGLSALALLEGLPLNSRLVTFDIVPWHALEHTVFRPEDLISGRLEQIVDDVTRAEGAARHRGLLTKADFVFVDAAKDGSMEARFLDVLDSISFNHAPIVAFDDIRLWNMLAVWRGIDRPKLDLTSFGHWSGTGIVDWIATRIPSAPLSSRGEGA